MPFSYDAEREVLQVQTDAQLDGLFEVMFS